MGRPMSSAILQRLGEGYALAQAAKERNRVLERGAEAIDLSIGDPRIPPPPVAIAALERAAREAVHHEYPPAGGTAALREAFAAFYERRYGLKLDPARQVLPLLGAKEGLTHLAMAWADADRPVWAGEVGYPIYRGAATLVGAPIVELPGGWDEAYVPSVPAGTSARGGIAFVASPSNPTSAGIPGDALVRLVEELRRRDVVTCFDAAYAELRGSGDLPLALPLVGDDLVVELHTLSKSVCLAGWRVAFAVGSPEVLAGLAQVKGFVDAGLPAPFQRATVDILGACDEHVDRVHQEFLERQRRMHAALAGLDLPILESDAGMFAWVRAPGGDGKRMAALCADESMVVVPGGAFGPKGAPYIRMNVAVAPDLLPEVRKRLKKVADRLRAG